MVLILNLLNLNFAGPRRPCTRFFQTKVLILRQRQKSGRQEPFPTALGFIFFPENEPDYLLRCLREL
jgi:hypothetical protein